MSKQWPMNPRKTEMNNSVADAELRRSVLAPAESWMLQAPAARGGAGHHVYAQGGG